MFANHKQGSFVSTDLQNLWTNEFFKDLLNCFLDVGGLLLQEIVEMIVRFVVGMREAVELDRRSRVLLPSSMNFC